MRNVLPATQLLERPARHSNEIALDLSPDQAKSVNSSVKVAETPSPNVFFLFANSNPKVSATSSNVHIQNAIRYAIDYNGLVSIAGAGAVQAAGVVPSMFLGALKPGSGDKTDLAKAKSEVAASGISNPTMSLEFPTGFSSNGLDFGVLAAKVKSDLAAVGITVNLQGSAAHDLARHVPRGHRADGPLVLGPGLPGPERLPRVPAGRDRRPARRLGGRLERRPRGARQEGVARWSPPSSARPRSSRSRTRLNASGSPFYPLLQPGQVTVGSKNLTNYPYNALYWLDVAAVGSN